MSDSSRIARRLGAFAVAATLAFGGGYALAQAWPGDGQVDTDHDDMNHDDMNMDHGDD